MIEVVATRWICDQSPEGAILTLPDHEAAILIELGFVKRTAAPAVPRTTGAPPAEPGQPPAPDAAIDPGPPAAPPAKPAGRSYNRRDMAAKGSPDDKAEPQAGT